MGLLISKNGLINEYSRSKKRLPAKVSSRPEHQDPEQHKDQDQSKGKSNKHPFQKAIQSYQEQKQDSAKAKQIASHSPITASNDISVLEALQLMQKYRIHHLIFTDESKLIEAIVTDRDLLGQSSSKQAYHFATKEVIIAKEFTDIKVISSLIIDKLASAVPIVDEKDRLTGIITKTDLLEYLLRSQHMEIYV